MRARRPEAFSGDYEPVDAGPGTVSFVRGGDVLVAVRTRAGGPVDPPGPGWDEVIRDDEHGLAVFERVRRAPNGAAVRWRWMSAVAQDPVSLGREALSACEWDRAYELLGKADVERGLAPADLDRLSQAACWTRRYDEMLELLERAESGYERDGDQRAPLAWRSR